MMRLIQLVLIFSLFLPLQGQYYLKTFAGIPADSVTPGTGDNSPASTEMLNYPTGIWSDSNGNLYVCIEADYVIRKISVDGIISTIIGVLYSPSVDGTSGLGTETRISGANSIYGDSNGNSLYFSDASYFLWRYSLGTGIVSRYAGALPATSGFGGDGLQATLAVLNTPMGLFLSSVGMLFFADIGNHRIRMINTVTGIINTFAGSSSGFSGDNNPATLAKLNSPRSVWGNSLGIIFITDTSNQRIRRVEGNIITTYAGSDSTAYYGIGEASSQTFNYPTDIKGDSNGNMYVIDSGSCRLRFIDYSSSFISLLAGTGNCAESITSTRLALLASLYNDESSGLAVDSAGNIFMSEYNAGFIRLFTTFLSSTPTTTPTITPSMTPTVVPSLVPTALPSSGTKYYLATIAGIGIAGTTGDDGSATLASVNQPYGVWGDSNDNLFVCEYVGSVIRKISSSGIITTLIGTGVSSTSGASGFALSLSIETPVAIYGDSKSGMLYFSGDKTWVWRYNMTSKYVNRYVGALPGAATFSGDGGPSINANINYPRGLYYSSNGLLYITDRLNHRIRYVNVSTGIIRTIAGNGTGKFHGENIPASLACIYSARMIWLDTLGVKYIADSGNYRIRSIDLNGIIRTVAGTGIATPYNGDNQPAILANLNTPYDAKTDTIGNLYIMEYNGCRLRFVNTAGIIGTLIGSTTCGGATTNVQLVTPSTSIGKVYYFWINSLGFLYLAENEYNYIRKVYYELPTMTPTSAPSLLPSVSPSIIPTLQPTSKPSTDPTMIPTIVPSHPPSDVPTVQPSNSPTTTPTCSPSQNPTTIPTIAPTVFPSIVPTDVPTVHPSLNPSGTPSTQPTMLPSSSTQYYLTTIAGLGTSGRSGDDGPASSGNIDQPYGLWGDSNDNLFICEYGSNVIRKISSNGIITTVIGTGVFSASGTDGFASSINIETPVAIFGDTMNGMLYFASYQFFTWRYNMTSKYVSRYVGALPASRNFTGDSGPAIDAKLSYPRGLFYSSSGILYIADSANHRIRFVNVTTGIIRTCVGNGVGTYTGENLVASVASLYSPRSVWFNTAGVMYIADSGNHRIRSVSVDAIIRTVAGTGSTAFSGDNQPATLASLNAPFDVKTDTVGVIYIMEYNGCRLRFVNTAGIIGTLIGSTTCGGATTNVQLVTPDTQIGKSISFWVNSVGFIYFTESQLNYVRKLYYHLPSAIPTTTPSNLPSLIPSNSPSTTPTLEPSLAPSLTPSCVPSCPPSVWPTTFPSDVPTVEPTLCPSRTPSTQPTILPSSSARYYLATIAGLGTAGKSGDDGPASLAGVSQPYGIWGDSNDNLFICEYGSNVIRKISSNGIITTVVGTGVSSSSGTDGFASSINLESPLAITGDQRNGNLYIAGYSFFIWQYNNTSKYVSRIAGVLPALRSFSGDNGPAKNAAMNYPRGLYYSSNGMIYLADRLNHRIRTINITTGIIRTFVGDGIGRFYGDNGPATLASLNSPRSVWLDTIGAVYIVDSTNLRIRYVGLDGIIRTIAGTGISSFNGDNQPATSANLNTPYDVKTDSIGIIYITEYSGCRLRFVNTAGIIGTLIGSTACGIAATNVQLVTPSTSIGNLFLFWINSLGFIYFTEDANHYVRKLYYDLPSTTPTSLPTYTPSAFPSPIPTHFPSFEPSAYPTIIPSPIPSFVATTIPSTLPSFIPSYTPSQVPSYFPTTMTPSLHPTDLPTLMPSCLPSSPPSIIQTSVPSTSPTPLPSTITPSELPTQTPTILPSIPPSTLLSNVPTIAPSSNPSHQPSTLSTDFPTIASTSLNPTLSPSNLPSAANPTILSTEVITNTPITSTVEQPTIIPSLNPKTTLPTFVSPSTVPLTLSPTNHLSKIPSITPSFLPSFMSLSPGTIPTKTPTSQPSTTQPSNFDEITVTINSSSWKQVLSFIGVYSSSEVILASIDPSSMDENTMSYVMFGSKDLQASRKSIILSSSFPYSSSYPVTRIASSYHRDSISRSAVMVGDMNGDSLNDLIVCYPLSSRCFLFFGRTEGLSRVRIGVTLIGQATMRYDYFGFAVSVTGDVNGDGFRDVIISAITGKICYVIYGRSTSSPWPNELKMADMVSGLTGHKVVGDASMVLVGISVAGTGDMNGDGLNDVAISIMTSFTSPLLRYVVYVVFGVSGGGVGDVMLSSIGGVNNGFRVYGEEGYYTGFSISGGGDMNGDGLSELLIGGIPYPVSGSDALSTDRGFILFGRKRSYDDVMLSNVTSLSSYGVKVEGGGGFVVTGIGDVNHDGYDDMMLSSCLDYIRQSNAYLVSYPTSMTSVPSFLPSSFPSSLPSSDPSQLPSSYCPSIFSVEQPTSFPSVGSGTRSPQPPTIPSPTIIPTRRPTHSPSHRNTVKPTNASPTQTRAPSLAPSHFPTITPTRIQTIRIPSRTPTATSTLHTPSPSITTTRGSPSPTTSLSVLLPLSKYDVRHVNSSSVGGGSVLYGEDGGNEIFHISSFSRDGKSKSGWSGTIIGGRGRKVYVIYPKDPIQPVNRIVLRDFNHSSDAIDLSLISQIASLSHVSYLTHPLTIFLPDNQKIVISSYETMKELSEYNFIFHSSSSFDGSSGWEESLWLSMSFIFPICLLFFCIIGVSMLALFEGEKEKEKDMLLNGKMLEEDESQYKTSRDIEEDVIQCSVESKKHSIHHSSIWTSPSASKDGGEDRDDMSFNSDSLDTSDYEISLGSISEEEESNDIAYIECHEASSSLSSSGDSRF